jgi:predicted nucleotidyltransferase
MISRTILRKKRALRYFVNRLVEGEGRRHIGRIFLFGSLAEGRVSAGSDIDVLVFSVDSVEEVSRNCDDVSFDTTMRYGESIEPLVYCTDDLRFTPSFFLRVVVRRRVDTCVG